MRIIKPGKLPEQKTYQSICARCKCHFEFQQIEARYMSDQRDGDYLQIPCPTCHNTVTVIPR